MGTAVSDRPGTTERQKMLAKQTYDLNIDLGSASSSIFNRIILDVCRVRIGDYSLRAGRADPYANAPQ
ncbi:MAG: hypothetical protein DMF90_29180 [Acidobacteria bacterium]|nr:MAG: hypothetical protein DMF90_29180 [Acidobacteriota bacterium]